MYKRKYRLMEGAGDGSEGTQGAAASTAEGEAGSQAAGEGAAGAGQGDWRETLPESVREWDEVKNSENSEAFYEQMGNMRSRMGRSITLPASEAGDEEWGKFNASLQEKVPGLMPTPDFDDPESVTSLLSRMGRPEEANAYEIPEIEGIELPEDRQTVLREAALKANLTTKQFNTLLSEVLADDAQNFEAAQAAQAEQDRILDEKWGNAKPSKLKAAESVAKTFFGKDSTLEGAPANVIMGLAEIAKQMGGEGSQLLQMGEGDADAPAMTPDEAAENASIVRNKLANMPPSDPAYNSLVNKLVKYEKLANPQASDDTNLRTSFSAG